MLPEQDPPLGETGAIKWVRENLLSSTMNIILTLISAAIILFILYELVPWLLNSVWNAGSLSECREVLAANANTPETHGACWAVIRDRWVQLLMGTYPPAYYWRSFLALALLFVGLAPILFPERAPKLLYAVTISFPFVMPWLLWGGSFWIPILYMAGFVVAYIGYLVGARAVNSLLGIILAIVVAILWWLYATPLINDGLHRIIAQSRLETAQEDYSARADQLSESLAVLQARQDEVADQITEGSDAKDLLITDIRAERFRRQIGHELPDVTEHLEAAASASDFAGALASLRNVRDILTPFNADFAGPDLSRTIGELRTSARANNPLGPVPEDGAMTEEASTRLADMLALAEESVAYAETDGIADADLNAMVEEFNSRLVALTELREETTALGSDIFRQDEQRRISAGLVRNVTRLQDNQEALPGLIETATTMRAELPELVSAIRTIPDDRSLLEPAITDEDLAALRATLDAEDDVVDAESGVVGTYEELGRVGLAPVGSEQFGGFQLSLVIGITGILMSLPLGILLALGRQSPLLIINKISVVFIEVIRGVPLIVWLMVANFLLNFFLPPGTEFDKVLRVIIMVTLFASAYIAEVVRGGLAALPKGQYEAADALGLDYWKSMRLIVLPQALKISIPGIVNTFIGLFKDTTLVIFIGLTDPLGIVNQIRSDTDWNGVYWELFIFVGLLFFVFCFSMGRYSLFLERKLQREHR